MFARDGKTLVKLYGIKALENKMGELKECIKGGLVLALADVQRFRT